MQCKKCNYKEHTCSNCELTEEQEFYLRSLGVCSKCYTEMNLSTLYEQKLEDNNHDSIVYDFDFIKECHTFIKDFILEDKNAKSNK